MIKLLFTAILAMAFMMSAYCEQYAVVVGINGYKNARVLTCAANDAIDFAAYLKSPEQGGLKSANVILLHDGTSGKSPTRSSILDSVRNMCSKAQTGDRLIFFFTGHGVTVNKKSYIAPSEATKDPSTLISADAIVDMLSSSKAKEVLLFLDACRNPLATKSIDTAQQQQAETFNKAFVIEPRNTGPSVTVTFSSCSAGEYSFEWPEKNHGVFSFYLLQGLSGAADKDRNGVSLSELSEYVGDQLASHRRTQPGHNQNPWVFSNSVAGSLMLSAGNASYIQPSGQGNVTSYIKTSYVTCPMDEDNEAKTAVIDAMRAYKLLSYDITLQDIKNPSGLKVLISDVKESRRNSNIDGLDIETLDVTIKATVYDSSFKKKLITSKSFGGSIVLMGNEDTRRSDALMRAADHLAAYVASQLQRNY